MQRKKYRDYSETVELGHAFQIVKSSGRMRKITMKRLIKFAVLIIFGYILVSVYLKYRIAHSKADSLKDEFDYNQDKEVGNKDVQHQDIKEQIDKVFEDYKRQQEAKEIKDVIKEALKDDSLNKQDENEFKDEEERKVQVEVVDRIDDIEVDDDADFVKIDQDNAKDGVAEAAIYPADRNDEINEQDLEIEIEERLAEALKEAADEVEEERQEVNKDIVDKTAEEAEQIEEKLEQEEFRDAALNIQRKLNPLTIDEMKKEIARRRGKKDDDHEFPPFVTAARQTTFEAVLQLIYSIQIMMPGETIHVYDLDLDIDQKKQLITLCNVRVQLFMKQLFPQYVSNLDNLHWKPLVIQTALAEFGHIIWINPDLRLTSAEFSTLIHDSHDTGILVISQTASYSTFAVTHPSMLKFLTVDRYNMERFKQDPHLEIKAMIIHNTPEIHEKFMKLLTACAMEESCIAPPGAKKQCTFDFTGRKYANCHRYDESAINILLKNTFKFQTSRFAKSKASMFRPYDKGIQMPTKLKYCREQKDIAANEL